MSLKSVFGILVLLQLFSQAAFSACRPRLIFTNNVSLNNSNPTEPTIFVTKQNAEACNYFITFSKGNSADFNRFLLNRGTNQETYNVFKDVSLQTILKDIPDANANEVITGSFTTNDFFNVHRIAVFRNQQPVLPAGRYRDRIRIRIFEGSFGSTTRPSHTRRMRFRHDVAKEVRLSLVDTGTAFDQNDVAQSLNFGSLQTGESLGFDMMVQSNAGYEISMSSQNNGRLRNSAQAAQLVDYSLSVSGADKDLSSSQGAPVVVGSGSGVTSPAGDRLPVRVEIGSISGKLSGTYSDNITVTVTTTE